MSVAKKFPLRARWLELLLWLWLTWALVGLVWTPYDPNSQTFRADVYAASSFAHPLGIDNLGRDFFSRVWRGSGHTVLLGSAAAAGALLLAVGLLILERRGARPVRTLVNAAVSASLALPVFLVGLVLLVILPPSPWTLVLACAVGAVPLAFRQVRTLWIEQVSALHVQASRALGATRWHLAWFAMWPNLRPQFGTLARVLFAVGALELSGLAFLGLNSDPDFPELGSILRQNQKELSGHPWLVLWPGLLLSGLLLVVHLSGTQRRNDR